MKNKEKIFITNNFAETQALGEKIAKNLKGRETLALYGNLGSGKTTFVQGLAKGLGIKRRLISPTFIIIRKYRIKNQELRIKHFYHIDLYRIKDENDLKSLGIEEIVGDSTNIVAIEWAEKMAELLPKNRIDIRFEYVDENRRRITIDNF